MQFRLVCLLLLLFPATPALAVKATMVEVRSCDSIGLVDDAGKSLNIRLFGVVCPDKGENGAQQQPFSGEAVDFLKALLPAGLTVTVHDMRLDAMGRERGHTITLPGGALVQQTLLEAGLAWVSPLHCGACRDWKKSEKKARQTRKGLWKEEDPVPPWEWKQKGR